LLAMAVVFASLELTSRWQPPRNDGCAPRKTTQTQTAQVIQIENTLFSLRSSVYSGSPPTNSRGGRAINDPFPVGWAQLGDRWVDFRPIVELRHKP
jgi:hypothetical protein